MKYGDTYIDKNGKKKTYFGFNESDLIKRAGGKEIWNKLPKHMRDTLIHNEKERQRRKAGDLRPEEYEWFKECRGIAETY